MTRFRTRRLAVAGLAVAGLVAATVGLALPALAGLSTGTITGHLIDGGAPVANVPVTVWDSTLNSVANATTDNVGGFTVADLPAGDYKIEFTLPNSLYQYAAGKFSLYQADPITVAAGGVTTVDETVAPHGSLVGHLAESDGSPAAGAAVTVYSLANSDILLRSTTDPSGDYSLPYVPVGRYLVAFDDHGLEQFAHQQVGRDRADPLVVTAGAAATLNETLLRTGAVTGHLTDAGQPVEGVYVSLGDGVNPGAYAVTGPDGSYRATVFPGSYKMTFSLPNGLQQYAHGKTTYSTADSIVVTGGADTVVDEQVLPTGTVSGHLRDNAGNPVAGASVEVDDPNGLHFAYTDAAGAYSATLFPGTYRVLFTAPTGRQWATGKTSGSTADPVTVTAGNTTTVDDSLLPSGSVTVTVTDAVTHAPVTNFCASVDYLWDAPCTQTGTLTVAAVQPGLNRLWVYPSDAGYLQADPRQIHVVSGQTTTVGVEVTASASLTTTVRDAKTGAPLRAICLELVAPRKPSTLGMAGDSGCSDATGAVTLSQVKPGSYNVFAWATDGVHGHQWVGRDGGVGAQAKARTITLTAGATTNMPAVNVDRKGAVTGVVRDATTRQPVSHAIVAVSTFNAGFGAVRGLAVTDSTGQYTMDNLGPYEWTMFFQANGYASEFSGDTPNRLDASGVSVRVGKSTTYDVGLSRGVILRGTVVDPNGDPAAASITVVSAASGDETTLGNAGPDGTYAINLLGEQTVTLQIDAYVYGEAYRFWYVAGTDLASATVIRIPNTGPKTVNITLTQPS